MYFYMETSKPAKATIKTWNGDKLSDKESPTLGNDLWCNFKF